MARHLEERQGRVTLPLDLPIVKQSAAILMDCFAFAAVTGGNLQSFSLGSFEGFGNERVTAKIRSRVKDPAQFNDLMLELSVAAFHQSEGHKVTPYEEDGWPDMRIDQGQGDYPMFVECKRVSSKSPNRLAKCILKANNQLKVVPEESFGVVVLDVAPSIGVQDLSDVVPAAVDAISHQVTRILAGPKNRSVDRVIITWDDVGTLGTPPERMVVAHRRCLQSIDHEPVAGVRSLPTSLRLYSGATSLVAVEFQGGAAA